MEKTKFRSLITVMVVGLCRYRSTRLFRYCRSSWAFRRVPSSTLQRKSTGGVPGRHRRVLMLMAILIGVGLVLPSVGEMGQRDPGIVVWRVVPKQSEGTPSFQVGDRLLGWTAPTSGGTIRDSLGWMWFRSEWAGRGGCKIRLDRDGHRLELPFPNNRESLVAGPFLPRLLRKEAEKLLWGEDSAQASTETSVAAALERKVAVQNGAASSLWFQIELARVLVKRGLGAEALACLDRARESAEAIGDPRADLMVLQVQSDVLLNAGKPADAADACRDLLKKTEILRGAPITEAYARWTLGRVLRRQGDLEKSAREFERAVSLARGAAPGSPAEAAGLDRLGNVLADLGQMDRAREAAEKGLNIRRKIASGSVELADSYNTMGNIALMTGRLDEAEQAYRHSLQIREGLPGRPGAYKNLHNLALIQYQRRNLKEAMRLMSRARNLLAQEPGKEAQTGMVLNSETGIAMEQGDYRTAEELGERALEIFSRLEPDSVRTAMVLTNLGSIASLQGNRTRARSQYLRAFQILRRAAPEGPDIPVVLNNLADLDLSEGQYAEALDRFRGLLALLKKRGALDIYLAQVHQNIGYAALELGRTDEAEREVRTALAIRHSKAPRSRGEGVSLRLLGQIELAREHPAEAPALFEKAVKILQSSAPGTVYLAEALHEQARLHVAEGRRRAAIAIYFQAIKALDEQMERLGATETIRTRFRERYVGWYRELEDLLVEEGENARAFDVLEWSRARSLLALMAGRRLELKEAVPRALDAQRRALAREWDEVLSQLADAGIVGRRKLEEKLKDLRSRQEMLRERIRNAAPRLASLYYPTTITTSEAAQLLSPGCMVLAYSVGTDHTLLFILTADGAVTVHRIPAGVQELTHAVSLFRGLIQKEPHDPARADVLREASRGLGKLLIESADPLSSEISSLLILPDGPLNLLPFSALSTSAGGSTFLGERFDLSVEPSLSVLQELRRPAEPMRSSRRLVALACSDALAGDVAVPALRGADAEKLPAIPGTLEEVRTIVRTWGSSSLVLTGGEATEGRLLKAAPSARLLHIAAHVILDTVHPLDSAIVLERNPDPEGENGLLQGWEIMESLRLPSGLVTLSGCETGLGRTLEGEGLIGLTRAFEYSGARAVLSSLWRIDDQSTAFLMGRFYAHLAQGVQAGSAFRRARNDLLHRPPQRPGLFLQLRHFLGLSPQPTTWAPDDPAVWAAFQLHGDPTLAFPTAP